MNTIKPIVNYSFGSLNKEVEYILKCTDIAKNANYDLTKIDLGLLYRKAQNNILPYEALKAFFTLLTTRLDPTLDSEYILFWTKKFNQQVDQVKNGVINPGITGKYSDCVGILSNDEFYISRETVTPSSSVIPKNIVSPFIKLPATQSTLYNSLNASVNAIQKENLKVSNTTKNYTEETLIFKAAVYAKLIALYTNYISILNNYAKINNIQINELTVNEELPYIQIKKILSDTVENLNLAQQNIQKDYTVYNNSKLLAQ